MLLICGDENALSEAERAQCYGESTQLAHDPESPSARSSGSRACPTARLTRREQEGIPGYGQAGA
jgi:hypothetical protein